MAPRQAVWMNKGEIARAQEKAVVTEKARRL